MTAQRDPPRGGALCQSTPARRQVTLWQLMQWAYQRQNVHTRLKTPKQLLLWLLTQMGALPEDERGSPVTWDAAVVHAAVTELSEEQAALLIGQASLGELPEPPEDRPPTPGPAWVDRRGLAANETYETPRIGGRKVDVLVRTIAHVSYQQPVVEHRGKGRRKVIVGYETVTAPVTVCPLRWEPDPWMQEIARNVCMAWNEAMARLPALIADFGLRDHELVGDNGSDLEIPGEHWLPQAGDIPPAQAQRSVRLARIPIRERYTVDRDGVVYERKARAALERA